MDGDGDYDIIQTAFDGKIYVFDEDGEDIDGFPYLVTYKGDLSPAVEPNRIFTTAATGDFNGDGTG